MRSLREFIERHRFWVIAAAVLMTAAAILFALRGRPLPERVIFAQAFFVDETTGEVSVHNMGDIAPLLGKEGKPTVVRAHFYSCDGGKTRKISHFEKYTDDGKKSLLELYAVRKSVPSDELLARVLKGTLVRRPAEGAPWVTGDAPEAIDIANTRECPPGSTISVVLPPKAAQGVVLEQAAGH